MQQTVRQCFTVSSSFCISTCNEWKFLGLHTLFIILYCWFLDGVILLDLWSIFLFSTQFCLWYIIVGRQKRQVDKHSLRNAGVVLGSPKFIYATIFKKSLVYQTKPTMCKRSYTSQQTGFIPGRQEWFSIVNSKMLSPHQTFKEQNKYIHINWYRTNIWKASTYTPD